MPREAGAPRSAISPRFGGYRAAPGERPNFVMRPPGLPYRGPRQPYRGGGFRRPYRGPYIVNGFYGVPGYPFVSPYVFGDYDDIDTIDAADAQPTQAQADDSGAYGPENGYDGEGSAQDQPMQPYPNYAQAPPSPYRPSYQAQAAQPAAVVAAPVREEAVTLIFKDGRPPETIHNYVLTASTLYVGDEHRRAIPVDSLDLAATEKANQDAGVTFALPAGTR